MTEKQRDDYMAWQSGQLILSQCAYCQHKLAGPKCEAFPDGIPGDILANTVDHRKKQPGDNGIQFEQRAKGPEMPWAQVFPDDTP